MNNLLVKFFAYADMLFMTAFILAVLIGDIKWLSVTTSCGLDALVGLVAVILGVTTGWWN